MKSIKIGIEILPIGNLEKIVNIAKLCEESNLDSIWVTDHYYNKNVYITLTLLTLNTEKIMLGIGVTNPYVVHPAWTASAVATLQELSRGRIILGIGAGDKTTLESIGIERVKPLKAVKECVEIIRRLLNCEILNYEGEIFKLRNAKLNIKSRIDVPIYIGAQAPKMLKLAGEIGDGVLINASDPEYVRECVRYVEEGLERSGRSIDKIDIAVCTCFSVDEDRNEAIEAAKPIIAYILSGMSKESVEKIGMDYSKVEKIRYEISRGNILEACKIINEEDVNKLAIVGTPEECLNKIEKIVKIGVRHIILGSPLGKDKKKAISHISEIARQLKGI